MEDMLGLAILGFFIWICYLNWKKHSVMVDCSSYYSEPSVSQEYKNLSGPKIEEKRCENGSTSYVDNPEIKKENSACLYKKPTPSPDNELILPDVLDIKSEEKVVLTPLPFLDPFDDPEMEYDFFENESFCSDYPEQWEFPIVVHIHFAHIPGLDDMPADMPPEIAIVTHIHTDKAQIREFILRLRKDYRHMSDDYVDYLSQLFFLNPMFSYDPSKGGVAKITEDPDIPCEYPSVTEQKEELEQSEADDIKETVDHHHVLYVGPRAEVILNQDYKQYPKVYHFHYLEISEEFLSDIAKTDVNQDTFTFQYSPATRSNGHCSIIRR